MKLNRPLLLSMAAFAALISSPSYGQLRIVSMNASNGTSSIAQPRAGMGTILTAIGASISDDPTTAGNTGIIRPIDVLALQEVHSGATTGAGYAALLNSIYNTTAYQYVNMNGGIINGDSAGTQGLVYNSNSVSIVNPTITVGTTSGTGQPRQALRYQIRPVGYSSTADIYLYNSHYKAADNATDANRRNVEALAIRADADALPAGSNIIYTGDMNVYRSSEPMYQTLTVTSGNGKAFDPINKPGDWNNASGFKNIHTQSPFDATLGYGFSGTTGGMDDRFDQQLISSALNDGNGMAYIPNSYQAFGNNGSHTINQPLNSGSGASVSVLNSLSGYLDHLPVVADYQIPAKMGLSVGTVAAQVIQGASITVNATVSNMASVSFAIGADELNYTGAGSGKLSGAVSGSDNALAAGNVHVLTLNTANPGTAVGTVSVNSSSQGAASASLSATVNTTVLAHANPSFSLPTDTNSKSIDFGIYANGSGSHSAGFSIANVADASGFTAGLKLVSINGVGSTGVLTTNAGTFANQAASGSTNFNAAIATTGYGTFTATYTLATADQDLPGAIARENLVLSLSGVVALGGDVNLDGFVGTEDFNELAGNFGMASPTWQSGDFNRDGSIDSTDFTTLAAHFGERVTMSAPSLGATVPEPASLGLLVMAAGCCLSRRRR